MKKIFVAIAVLFALAGCVESNYPSNTVTRNDYSTSASQAFYIHTFADGTKCYMSEDRSGHAQSMSCKTVKEQ